MIITKITNWSHIFFLFFFALNVLFANGENCVEHIYKTLERMNEQERNNSEIKFLFESDESYGTKPLIKTIEELWNSGNYESAINRFSKIEPFINNKEIGLEIHWKEPIKTKSDDRWAQDIRIGNRDSVYAVAFDVHRATGNLFAVALRRDGSNSGWSVNYSTNGGYTWYERYYYTYTYSIRALSAGIVANHCYVCFSRPAAQNQAYLYRFRATDAQRDSFSNGSYYVEVFSVTSPDSIEEIVLIGDQDDSNTRLYCGAIINDGNLRFLWDDTQAISWSSIATGITDADRGIDISKNVGFAHYWMLISYINFNHRLRIYGLGYGLFDSISKKELLINSGGKDE